jgi:hypothetical protein
MHLLGTDEEPSVLTCGFDGRVALQLMGTGKFSFNVVVDPEETISSVKAIGNSISCTSDQGNFYLYDRRVAKKVSEISIQNLGQAVRLQELFATENERLTHNSARNQELYTHTYLTAYELLLGTSDGQIMLFDNRYQSEAMVSYVNLQERLRHHSVGDVVVDRVSKSFFAFGTGSIFSSWRYKSDKRTAVELAACTNTFRHRFRRRPQHLQV